MGLLNQVEDWIFTIALKKALIKGCVALAAYAAATGALQKYGISVDWNLFQAGALTGGAAALEFARNWLKTKYGLSWL